MGAVASILVYLHGPIRTAFMQRALRVLAVIGAGYTLWLWSTLSERSDALYRGGFLLASLAVVLVIVSVTQPNRGLLGRALSWYPLRWIGMISYGLYLWHWPVYLTITGTRTGLEGNALLFARLGRHLRLRVSLLLLGRTTDPARHVPHSEAGRSPRRCSRRRCSPGSCSRRAARVRRPRARHCARSPRACVLVRRQVVGAGDRRPPQPRPHSVARRPRATAAPPPPVQASVLMLGDSVAISLGQGLDVVAEQDPSKLVSVNRGTLGCGMLRNGDDRHGPPALRAAGRVQRLERALARRRSTSSIPTW